MNSNSNSRYCDDYEPKRPVNYPFKMKCSAPGYAIISAAETTVTPTTLSINTKRMCEPCTRIDVCCNYSSSDFEGTLTFQVVKLCRNQYTTMPIHVGPTFTFTQNFSQGVGTDEAAGTFTFFVCDCDCDCSDRECCTYSLNITSATGSTGSININNATLSAITTELIPTCCRD